MYCPKCGAENQNMVKQCENCGFLFHLEEEIKMETKDVTDSNTSNENVATKPETNEKTYIYVTAKPLISKEKILGIVLFGIAVIVFLLSVIGSISIFYGGTQIAQIQSVGGKTLEEAYYYRLYSIYNGIGIFVLTAGMFCSAMLSAIGCFCYWKQPLKSGK